MSFPPNISGDALLVDGTETVTLEGASTTTVAGAKRSGLAQREITLGGLGLEPTDVVWSLPGVSLQSVRPEAGDRITQIDGTKWTVLSATHAQISNVWRAVCRKQR